MKLRQNSKRLTSSWPADIRLNCGLTSQAPFTRYNLLSNRLSNQFDNRLYRVYKHSTGCQSRLTTGLTTGCIVYTAGCQTGCRTRFDNRLNEQWLFVQHGCQSGCQIRLTTSLTTGCMLVYTIQPVVKPVVQPFWQPVVLCIRGISKNTV